MLFGSDEGRPHHRSWPDEDQNKSHGGDDGRRSQDDHCHGTPCTDVQQPQRAEKRGRTRARATDLSFIVVPPLSKCFFQWCYQALDERSAQVRPPGLDVVVPLRAASISSHVSVTSLGLLASTVPRGL